jgi:hypothetical protein
MVQAERQVQVVLMDHLAPAESVVLMDLMVHQGVLDQVDQQDLQDQAE